ncbi:MAG: hypothetical protein LBJ77_03205 [Holosporales bacterium]|jgi:trk system potassium uptake protein TrkH|nr:hypothetical protein [Holosporales bacterium]
MKVNLRAILFIVGIIICGIAGAMLGPLFFDILRCGGRCSRVFIPSGLICIFVGVSTIITYRFDTKSFSISRSDTFLLVVTLWIIVSIFGALPFYFYHGTELTFIQSLFESVSGITTTGVTVYPDVESLPRAIHLWRFILHFIGGVGIVAIGIVILPAMRVGGMQLFSLENSDKTQKILPRASQIAGLFVVVYCLIVLFFAVLLKLSGMTAFDSLCHSISAISTGGFSTKTSGIVFFKNPQIFLIVSLAMFVGGISFIEIIKCFKFGFGVFFKNQQTLCYLKIVLISIILPLVFVFVTEKGRVSMSHVSGYVLRVVSSISTTGFDSDDGSIGMALKVLLFTLAIIGGCSGSTSGGIKIFRIQVLFRVLKHHIAQTISPYEIKSSTYQGQKISDSLVTSVISFFSVLAMVFIVSVVLVSLGSELDEIKSCKAVVSCLFNLGYDINIVQIPPIAKIILIIDMIIGRLEIIPIFIIFTHGYWKK